METMRSRSLRGLAAFAFLVGASACAVAAPPTFRISQVYSSPGGDYQFVELVEWAGQDDQTGFAGLTLTMTGADGVVRKVTFLRNLPDAHTAHESLIVIAGIEDDEFPFLDYGGFATYALLPPGFIDTLGGKLDFAGVDQVDLPALPVDGGHAWYRDGGLAAATMPDSCPTAPCPRMPFGHELTRVVEFHNFQLDRFMLTTDAAEIDALESGRIPGWRRSDGGFFAFASADAPFDVPVCRFYAPPAFGNAHFYTAFADECAALAAPGSGYIVESRAAFYVGLPDRTTGRCAVGYPVYRFWKSLSGADHLFTLYRGIDLSLPFFRGYVSEGFGPDGVAFCVAVPHTYMDI